MSLYRSRRARAVVTVAAAVLASACSSKKDTKFTIQTEEVKRRDIIVDAQSSGSVEPINVVEVKSKASGQIVRMPVETGTQIREGDLLVQVDARDVQNAYDQTLAELKAADAKLQISTAQKKRADEMFNARVITAQEHEAATLDYANAQAQVVRARTSLDLAKQRLEDATVRAPVAGTIIEKDVSLGQVITSATGAFGGGTTLLKMADLSQVRVRALVNETDIGNVRPGQSATVTVDAYPDRPFRGTVEKIEPQAVVQQSVTMFPVLVSLSNREGLLKPGMNGEVSVLVERRDNVIAIPNDAIRSTREVASAAQILGLNPDSVAAQVQAQREQMFRGMNGTPADTATRVPVAGAPGNNGPTRLQSRGEVDLSAAQQQGGEGGFRQGGMQLPDVTDAQCAAVTAAFTKHPDARKKLDDMRERARSGEIDFNAMREESQKIYQSLGVDPMVARACNRRQRQDNGGEQGAAPAGGTNAGGRRGRPGASPAATPATSASPSGSGVPFNASGAMNGGRGGMGRGARPGLVFVAENGTYKPRIVRLGVSDFDYTEVISGVKEGEKVALLAAAAMQMQRQQQTDRMRSNMGGGVPGMQRQTGGAGGGGGGGGGRNPR